MINKIVAIQGNHPTTLNPKNDTSIFLAEEVQKKKYKIFQWVFRDVPVSGLPVFLGSLSTGSVGFLDPFINENKIYVVRLFQVLEPEKQTLQNSYESLYNFTRSSMIEEKIISLINKHKEEIFVKTFY